MSQVLRPYEEYSASPADWLGVLPSHWKTLRSRYLFKEVDNRSQAGEETHLSMSQRLGLVPSKDMSERRLESESYKGGKLCQPGDLVLNRLKAHLGVFATSRYSGVISPDYTVLNPITDQVRAEYYELVLKSPGCRGELRTRTKGLVEGFWRLYTDDFYCIRLPVPPPDELNKILRYVRHLDHRVNRLIKTKRRLIELLNEQKQAIIHRAVTRGLDPSALLKPSGIEWLGDVPAHWSVKPLKRWASMNAQTLTDKTPGDFEFRYLDIGTVGTGRLVREPERMLFEGAPSRAKRIVRSGDTIISTVRTYLKAMYFIESVEEPVIASTGFAVLSPTRAIIPRYLSYLIQSADFINRVTANSIGIAYPAISESRMGCFHLAAPEPSEQLEILAHLDLATEPFDNALSKAQAEIDFIREYRTRLVADVVTGQLDVRHLALPEVEESLIEAIDAGESDDPDEELEAQEVE